jgi:uncharacterized small protein (DUF1192 family)
MTDLATLKARLDLLKTARASGARRTRFEDFETEYRSDAELLAAITALQDEIDRLEGSARPRAVLVRAQKGWE